MLYMDYSCRRTIKKDLSFWKEIYLDGDVKMHMNAAPVETDKELWEHLNHSDRYVVYGDENELIGGFSIYHRDNKTAEFGIVVHPKHRNKGYGTLILNFLKDTAKDLGIRTLKADVYEENIPCISLLKKDGFKPIIFLEKNL